MLFGLVFFLFAFAKNRNSDRKITSVDLHFTNSENLYITEETVNKLLTQNEVAAQKVVKESLDLSRVERVLDAHEMIENAEVFVNIDGKFGATITQRKPIARIMGLESFYLDRQGLKMPLSESYSARVPLVSGVSEDELEEIYPLITYIREDEFLSRHITGLHRLEGGKYEFEVRRLDFVVFFGKPDQIAYKFNNLKAFYQKAMKDKKLNTYKKVDLRFGDQVVATKK